MKLLLSVSTRARTQFEAGQWRKSQFRHVTQVASFYVPPCQCLWRKWQFRHYSASDFV
ncbi:hypothetical protein A2U01_0081921 [Trifolium medium]|uniref:Uncharacterized protein n=1 Tax=Trifolium medium TaxID=97028 RepID=A0A392TL56_9FABA|nr:hypothetical protein [Trifolium medium]